MKNLVFKILLFLSLISVFYILNSSPAHAQTQPNSISVTPSIAYIDLATDPPFYKLIYQNNTKYDITLNLSVKDFTTLEEGYKLSFIEGKSASDYKYSLSSWVSFENPNIELSPAENRSVKVFIDKDRITKGGHYASILAEVSSPEKEKNVNVKAVISSLLFVRASTGKEVEEASVSSLTALRDNFEYPAVYVLRFQNSGNVYVVPYGVLKVRDSAGNEVSRGILNEDSLTALPESIRRYEVEVKNSKKFLMPGFYTASLSIHYGKENKKLEAKTKFFSYGSFNPAKIILGLVLIGILIFYLRRRGFHLKNKN